MDGRVGGWVRPAERPSPAEEQSAVDRRLLVYKNHNPASRGWAGARNTKGGLDIKVAL